jgi:hypothetical protein
MMMFIYTGQRTKEKQYVDHLLIIYFSFLIFLYFFFLFRTNVRRGTSGAVVSCASPDPGRQNRNPSSPSTEVVDEKSRRQASIATRPWELDPRAVGSPTSVRSFAAVEHRRAVVAGVWPRSVATADGSGHVSSTDGQSDDTRPWLKEEEDMRDP